ncbi:MAG: DUF1538 domain-containing protein [Magnetococcus sp. WYHC-3]
MGRNVRFADLQREVRVDRQEISYNRLTPRITLGPDGRPLVPYIPPRVTLTFRDIRRLLRHYTRGRFLEQFKAVVPLAVYLVLFQVLILRQLVSDSWSITGGLLAVIVGLMLFMEGLKLGLMPFGETIGHLLPTKSSLPMVLFIAFLLGMGVTFAEPAIGALKTAGQIVQVTQAPYLYALLNLWSDALVLVVGAGVGLAAVLGALRFLHGWSLKPLIYTALVPAVLLTLYCAADPHLVSLLGLAWDCGGVTTGPVTVPLVLALGIGIAAATGNGNSALSGFGIVTLASIFPVAGVLGLGVLLSWLHTPESIIALVQTGTEAAQIPAWYSVSPGADVVMGVRAIVPLVLFLLLVLRLVLREPIHDAGVMAYGITLAVLGMVIFNLGLTYGLSRLGGQAGALVPAAFTHIQAVLQSPLYVPLVGWILALTFAWFLGFGATLAEPALNALGVTVENLTQGVFRKSTLMLAVSLGVAFGLALGVAKIIFDLPLAWLMLPLYALAVALTALSSEEYVNIAWDSAGVTTGPITVPLVLAMGLGVGDAVQVVEGFGILAMASICPILVVLLVGQWLRLRDLWERNRATP